MTISALPPAPSRSDPATFSAKSDALLGALDQFVTETNAEVAGISSAVSSAGSSASAAAGSATAANNSAVAAAASASAAAATAGAVAFVPSQTYTLNQVAISGVNSQTYRHNATPSSLATDPANDATNWTLISGNVNTTLAQTLTNKTIHGDVNTITVDGTNAVGFRTIPQNSQSAAYTAVLADSGKHLLHPSADTTARTFTIPANASVAYPIGTALTFVNQNAAGVLTIAITTDTMRLAGAGTTGSRTLAANGVATAIKLTATEWIISGTGLT